MLRNLNILLFYFLLSISALSAQTVSTFITGSGLNGPDGFALDVDENLYVANWGGGQGSTVLKITPSGQISTFVRGLNAPDGLAFDSLGNLYVSNFASGIINKVTPGGSKTVFASGFNNPSDLVFDKEWNLYVSNHGNGTGSTVSKIDPAGNVTTFASGFNAPLGLVFDDAGMLYVSNYGAARVNKVDRHGTVSVFATLPNSPAPLLQYLAIDAEGNIYVPSYGQNKIYKLSPEGRVSLFAGTGLAGSTNGDVHSARFNGPNSIAITQSGDIYVAEYNANRIRKISSDLAGISSLPTGASGKPILHQNYPNPFSTTTIISYEMPENSDVSLIVHSILGKELLHIESLPGFPGSNTFVLQDTGLKAGFYFYHLLVNELKTNTHSMMVKGL